jgi:predicted amidohydrolase/ribosomal protein S18 acetylase RimI-like enzyme
MEKLNTKTRVSSDRRLEIRNATLADLGPIMQLYRRVYPGEKPYSAAQLRGQIHGFPEGQFVATYDGRVVGYCATFRISGAVALKAHTWKEITGSGFASRHDPEGEYLYGMEIFVDPELRGYRIGQRLYDARKWLCKELELAGILFAGRIPSWRRRSRQFDSIEDYIEAVRSKKKRDPVLSFQMRNGFEVLGVIKDYLPGDTDSLGYAVHMIWRNPAISPEDVRSPQKKYGERLPDTVRVATVQYMQRRVNSFDEFLGFIEYFVDVVADYRADFVVFPELFPLQLLSITDQRLTPADAIEALTKYNEPFKVALREMAIRYNINIIGGSHPVRMDEGEVRNISYVFHRDGHISQQEKIHPTPNESYWWNIEGGSEVVAIQTDCGPIGVLICYDAEFPELARHLVDQGANILFVPFCTDERQSYLRVRYCCQARAVENQCYVVMSGNCGNLPGVANMDIQYAQSCILTPCDFPFARDGIAADTTPNVETVAFADLRLESLMMARNAGTVQNLKDRRHDLYGVEWRYKS